ncbi:hypothetical protein NEHOM01_2006 [Nematocida homosporus]|uniref:uncharacterized protein n=1 Tax=Nematocida homosporus TaxID=1912981 RepID=UPI00222113F2|nr:uncharacterized protein NEHOM01_2006 [Nematocida homosporus]KAI5187208.1 hypothetical protein NEHOM01_2006 [Nematocida homosporus]
MFDQEMIIGGAVKVRRCKMIVWWCAFWLYLLLMLYWVRGVEWVEGLDRPTRPGWSESEKMVETMQSIGFVFDTPWPTVWITSYICCSPTQPVDASNPEPSPSSTTPHIQYLVRCWNDCLSFKLPTYSDVKAAEVALAKLRTIDLIKVDRAFVTYRKGNPSCQHENLLILSRVVNVLDCTRLEIRMDSSLKQEVPAAQLTLALCLKEARAIVDQATYHAECWLRFASKSKSKTLDLTSVGVVLLRPISSVFIEKDEFQDISYLSRLPLMENYVLYFRCLPSVVNLDLGFLHLSSPKCSRIVIETITSIKIKVTGLENATANHPKLVLETNWMVLKYLAEHNKSQIRVHTILDLSIDSESIQAMTQPLLDQIPVEPCIIATNIILKVPARMPCHPLSYYSEIYNREAFAKNGILIEGVQISYVFDRSDLYRTLHTLVKIGALSIMPESVMMKEVICCGQELNQLDWELQEPVTVCLDESNIDSYLADYNSFYTCFCQNIRYQTLEITGEGFPSKGSVKRCIALLNLFRNISARKLKIADIRDSNKAVNRFDLTILEAELDQAPRYRFDIDSLLLCDVDEQIIYWIFGHYEFSRSVEVCIQNQHFKNLAITQILCHPVGHNISSLVINDLCHLNELTRAKKRHNIKGFSLFKHIEAAQKDGKTPKDLNLHKLILQLDNTASKSYHKVLTELLGYDIQFSAMPLKTYIACITATSQNHPIFNCIKDFSLYEVTLEVLTTDFISCHSKDQTQLSLIQKKPVETLTLRFSTKQFLTEVDLVTIIRWISCRFTSLTTLRLINAKVTESVQRTISSRDYIFIGLDLLSSIRLEDVNSSGTAIELLTKRYSLVLIATASNVTPAFTIVPHQIIIQLLSQLSQLDDHMATHTLPDPNIQKILAHLKESPTLIECPLCCKELCMTITKKKEADNPSDDRFTTICYLECGGPICNLCVAGIHNIAGDTCPYCRKPNLTAPARQLISAPLSSFVFADSRTTTPRLNQNWLNTLVWPDNQIYLYFAYKHPIHIPADLDKEIIYDPNHPIHII